MSKSQLFNIARISRSFGDDRKFGNISARRMELCDLGLFQMIALHDNQLQFMNPILPGP
jgi:hypothetical protein